MWTSNPSASSRFAAPPRCSLCGRPLGIDLDPLSGDCGGDCWGCVGLMEAECGGDPEENLSVGFVAKEIARGWRDIDGTPRPQSLFVAGDPSFVLVRWRHSCPDDPIEIWSELDADRREVRKVEIWRDGRVGYAFGDVGIGGTRLGEIAVPSLEQIAEDPEFEAQAISRFAFEECWDRTGIGNPRLGLP